MTLGLPVADEIFAAAARIAGQATVTPVLRSRTLEAMTGCQLFLKGEHLQRSGAFKFRGSCNAVSALGADTAARGVVTHSSGNHGAALALAARERGIPCHVVVPEGAIGAKLANIVRHGATLWRCAPTQEAREATCAEVAARSGASVIHPYENRQVIAGQGTAALELLDQSGGLDLLVVPVGGGGLAAGSALALEAAGKGCRLLLAEPAGAADTAHALAHGEPPRDFVPDTVCDGLRARIGAPNLAVLRQAGAEVAVIDDQATLAAMRLAWQVLKQTIEPSSALALAAVLARAPQLAGQRVGVIISGGNVDLEALPWRG